MKESTTIQNLANSLPDSNQSTASGASDDFVPKEVPISEKNTKEEILINSQFALFFDIPIQKPEELWISLNKEFDGVFNQNIPPVIIPVPNQPQLHEVPVVQLRSDDGIYTCNLSRGRADFFIAGSGKEKYSNIKSDLLEKFVNFSTFFFRETKINRIGFVTRFFFEENNQDKVIAKLLQDKFVRIFREATDVDNIHEVDIKYVSRITIDNLDVNNNTNVNKFFANITDVGANVKGILITRDFNSIPEKKTEYKDILNSNRVESFLELSEMNFKLDEIKKILWPEE